MALVISCSVNCVNQDCSLRQEGIVHGSLIETKNNKAALKVARSGDGCPTPTNSRTEETSVEPLHCCAVYMMLKGVLIKFIIAAQETFSSLLKLGGSSH